MIITNGKDVLLVLTATRKLLPVLCALLMLVVGCTAPATRTTPQDREDDQEHASAIEAGILVNTDVPVGSVSVIDIAGKKDVLISLLPSADYFACGGYFRDASAFCNNYLSENNLQAGRFNVSIADDAGDLVFNFSTSDFASCIFIDYRSGAGEVFSFNNIDDLEERFPAMKFTAAETEEPEESTNETFDPPDISDAVAGLAYKEAPVEAYTLSGAENGLMGTPLYLDGKVIKVEEYVLGDDSESPQLWLENKSGKFILLAAGPNVEPEGWNDLSIGDEARFYFIYTGMIIDYEIGAGIYVGVIPATLLEP